MARIPISLQLYSVLNDFALDMEKTFDQVKKIGYDAVEFAGFFSYTPERVKKALADNGLKVSGAHVGLEELYDENIEKTAEFHKAIGNKTLIVPWIQPEKYETYEKIKQTSEYFNNLSEKAKKLGVTVGYHNHTDEYIDLPDMPGKTAWTAMRELTVPEFIMQFDTGNALCGKADVNKEVLSSAGRLQIVHLKPYSIQNGYLTLIGAKNDDIDYKTILPFMLKEGKTHTIVIEYVCKDLFPDIEATKVNFDGLIKYYGDLLNK